VENAFTATELSNRSVVADVDSARTQGKCDKSVGVSIGHGRILGAGLRKPAASTIFVRCRGAAILIRPKR